jgi:hypothetical protein
MASHDQSINDPQSRRIPHIVHASLEGYAQDGDFASSASSLTNRTRDSADMPIIKINDRLPIFGGFRLPHALG